MKQAKFLLLLIVVLAFASCGSDEPRYADPEAHEKTVQLNEQYGPLMVGTWHYENISDTQCYFERLTFQADGTLTGMRKWQTRKLVTIDGEQRYTDWENVRRATLHRLGECGAFGRNLLRYMETELLQPGRGKWREAQLPVFECSI